jgi:hypothetical protein
MDNINFEYIVTPFNSLSFCVHFFTLDAACEFVESRVSGQFEIAQYLNGAHVQSLIITK